ncbi:MarR family transcriptional regulator [Streptomyces mexicanus]|uniref:MarR family transcriptional regulator n=1 Tax=Streptomyces mexicanus TaxID=178566 RepID=UPI003678ADFA
MNRALAAELHRFELSVQEDFADAVDLSHSGATRLITRLERRELVARRLCTADGRGIEVQLTKAGDELFGRLQPVRAVLSGALSAAGAHLADSALACVLRSATANSGPGTPHQAPPPPTALRSDLGQGAVHDQHGLPAEPPAGSQRECRSKVVGDAARRRL